MDDRLFELMTKMYSEMQEMKGDISSIKTDLAETRSDVAETKSDVRKIYNKIENNIEQKLETLFDGYKQTYELEKDNSKKLDDIAEKVVKQEVEIKVIQGGKK
jgi:uncharacterized coiled-coil DUF342 family protein